MTDATTGSTATGTEGASAGAGTERTGAAGAASTAATTTTGAAATGAAATEGQAAAATLASGGQATDAGKTAAVATTEGAAATTDWRDRHAGGDAAFRERLNRFASESDFAKSYRALEQKFSSGEYKRGLPQGAKPEEVAAWRKENGIPEKWEDFKLNLADGIVPGEADKPVLDHFKQFAHKNNINPEMASQVASWYYTVQDAQNSMRADADAAFKQTAEDKLRTEWGTDYRRKINAVGALRDGMPAGLYDRLLAGRTSDGTVIGNDPLVLSWLADLQATIDPAATLVPPGSGDTGKALNSRKAEIGKLIKDRSSDYYKGPNANALQAEYRQILDAESRMKGRAA